MSTTGLKADWWVVGCLNFPDLGPLQTDAEAMKKKSGRIQMLNFREDYSEAASSTVREIKEKSLNGVREMMHELIMRVDTSMPLCAPIMDANYFWDGLLRVGPSDY